MTTRETRFVSQGQHPVLMMPKRGQSSVDANVVVENGLVRGQLSWSKQCRVGVEERSYDEVLEVKKADRGRSALAIGLGALTGVLAGVILASSKSLSDEQTCSVYDGNSRCSSPKQNATIVGVSGILASVGIVGAGIGALSTKETSKVVDTIDRTPTLLRVEERRVPCGKGPVVGVGVTLVRGTDQLAISTTNADGRFALVIPARATGPLTVMVHSVPAQANLLHVDTKLAELDIPAVAEPFDAESTP